MTTRRIRGLTVDIDTMSAALPPNRDAWLQDEARRGIANARAINRATLGRDVDGQTRIDGAPATIDQMETGKTLSHVFAVQVGIVDWIYEELLRLSPVKSGEYRRSHRLFVNGTERQPPVTIGFDDKAMIVNTAAYAFLLEKRRRSEWAPDGIYEVIYARAVQRFGSLARITLKYVGSKQLFGVKSRDFSFPSITIEPPGGGRF